MINSDECSIQAQCVCADLRTKAKLEGMMVAIGANSLLSVMNRH